jgi:hypothetical protein
MLLTLVGCGSNDEATRLESERHQLALDVLKQQQNVLEQQRDVLKLLEENLRVLRETEKELREIRQEVEKEKQVLAELKKEQEVWIMVIGQLDEKIRKLATNREGNDRPPDTVPVTGHVKLDGYPIEGVDVVFFPAEGGRPALGVTDDSGKFTLSTFESADGAIPGNHNVAISSPNVIQGKSIIPAKYSDPKTSRLTCEVREGTAEFIFNLKSK